MEYQRITSSAKTYLVDFGKGKDAAGLRNSRLLFEISSSWFEVSEVSSPTGASKDAVVDSGIACFSSFEFIQGLEDVK